MCIQTGVGYQPSGDNDWHVVVQKQPGSDHLKGLLNHRLMGARCQVFDLIHVGWSHAFTLACNKTLRAAGLLECEPHFENHRKRKVSLENCAFPTFYYSQPMTSLAVCRLLPRHLHQINLKWTWEFILLINKAVSET